MPEMGRGEGVAEMEVGGPGAEGQRRESWRDTGRRRERGRWWSEREQERLRHGRTGETDRDGRRNGGQGETDWEGAVGVEDRNRKRD